MYYDEEYNSDTLLKENVDFYLKRAHNENMLYKVKEILGETYNHDIICLSRLIELEGILGIILYGNHSTVKSLLTKFRCRFKNIIFTRWRN